ncbi:DctP family TRAP transporter solute-binding subunit [Fredinandcohnia onubensis]|uniref:DctP family TRAP transporter solute-binding subunit n=1 Tax=Fredinandcohnia onubensis TaxID=1571209 RepID=UPI000C0C1011|nr:DctP family TRAP transporter solute-binding subunit [Fredinandcohnia onubensis]
MKKLILLIMVSALMLVSACSSNSNDDNQTSTKDNNIQELEIKVSYENAENTPKHKGAVKMKEYIEAETNGKIKVHLYPNGTLFGDNEEMDNLYANNVQFIIPSLTELAGLDPVYNLHTLPFIYESEESALQFWDGEKGKSILNGLEEHGLVGMSIWPNGEVAITNNTRPIVTPEDMKGLIFRIIGGQLTESMYQQFGAGTERIPFAELYTSLEQGALDGQENAISNVNASKLDEVQKYMTVTGQGRVDYVVLTNTKFYSSLNETTKKIIEEGVKRGTEESRINAKQLNDQALQDLKDRGEIEITTLTPEQRKVFREELQPIYDEWIPIIGEDIINELLK